MATADQKPLPSSPSDARSAGRGGLALAAGKIFFLVAGLIQQIALKSVLGLAGYGALATAQSVASITYNPIVQTGIQGVSRETASAPVDERPKIFRHLLGFHFLVAVLTSAGFFVAAHPLARLLGAPHIGQAIQILSGILFLYGLYSPMIGYLNGQKRFLAQAGLDAFAATLRTVGLVGGAFWATRALSDTMTSEQNTQLQVNGTVMGFVVAGVLILLVATRFSGLGRKGGTLPSARSYAWLVSPIFLGQVLLNLLFQADALLLRKFAANAAELSGLLTAEADPFVGAYRASQLFCFLPFQLLTSVTFVLFPLLASARAERRDADVSRLVGRGLRLALIIGGLIVSVLLAVPGGLLALVFGAETSALAAQSMRILAVGMGFFALLGVMTSALNSLGHEIRSLLLVFCAVVLVAGLGFGFAQTDELSSALLNRIAMATSAAMLLTTLAGGYVLNAVSGAQLPLLSVLRTILAIAASAWLVSRIATSGVVMTLLGSLATGILFLGFLVLTRELTKEDWRQLRAVVSR